MSEKLESSSRRRFQRFRTDQKKQKTEAATQQAGSDAKKARRRRFLREYLTWLKPWRTALAFVFFLAVLSMAFEMVLPMSTRRIIDGVLLPPGIDPGERRHLLNVNALGVIAALIFSQAIEGFRTFRIAVLNAKIIFSLRRRLFDRLIALPLSELGEMKSGGIVSRLSSDAGSVTGLAQMAIISPGVALAKVLLTLGILVSINPILAIAAALMLPPLTWISARYVLVTRPIYRSMADDRAAIDGRVGEVFGGIRVVRSFRREMREKLEYTVGLNAINRKELFRNSLVVWNDMGWSLLIPLTSLLIVWLGGILYLEARTSIGDIVAFQMYSTMLLFPVYRIVNSISETQRALASMERVFEVMDKPVAMPDRADAVVAAGPVDRITFEAVNFEYKKDKPVIVGFDLTIKGGEIVALVGPSGAGKTTITDLLARFHDPTSGVIRLNGRDLRDFKVDSFRRLLGVVQQDVFLFDGTVQENIAYGNPGATLAEVTAAAERANAHAFIKEFSDGYQTLIGERGVKLSGGQRQRLSIARAILADPEILILDEATSNLDSESEALIQAALAELFKGRTTIVIAHRLSTITHADQIVVIEKGRIMERGRHQELLGQQGRYASMVERQRRSFML